MIKENIINYKIVTNSDKLTFSIFLLYYIFANKKIQLIINSIYNSIWLMIIIYICVNNTWIKKFI